MVTDISAEIQLRPTRIGFLVRPNDLSSVRAAMRACTCLWGGTYNPIIPVFRKPPKEWKPEIYERFKGVEVAKGYIRFFEPDVYVETKKGLLEEAGLGAVRDKLMMHEQVITLDELFGSDRGTDWSEPKFGLNIHDVLGHKFTTEQQFVHRDKRESVLVKSERGNALTEALFGVYPTSSDMTYIQQAYTDVYRPNKLSANPDTWRLVFRRGAETPLSVTRHGLDTQRYWYHDPLLFVFDPTRATDLIDLWNVKLEPHPVIPIPIGWFEALGDDIYDLLKAQHRPVVGNPNGVMHNATIEFSRSIPKSEAEGLISNLKPGLPAGALVVKYWRNAIWIDHRDDRVHRDRRLKVSAEERRVDLAINDERSLHTTFTTLEPEFSEKYGRGYHRWVNVLRFPNYTDPPFATALPFNTFDRAWPRLGSTGDAMQIGSEGWVFTQHYKSLGQYVSLLSAGDAITGWLEKLGVKAKLSEPGHIAKQMLEHLGGLRGVHLLADLDTLKLLNKMAGGLRRKSNEEQTVEETFELRTATVKAWADLISRRRASHSLRANSLEDFTRRNVIRVGLETECPHCNAKNWSTLTAVDYRVTCERCLKPYDFPQAALRDHNRNWTYRVVGPFSVPDYGRGSYSALLCLRVLSQYRSAMDRLTFATAMNLSFDSIDCEVDFIAWHSEERMQETHRPPSLIIGEVKSFGSGELITVKDLAKLKVVAAKLPEAVVVIAVLRDHFTAAEKKTLTKFVNWGRRVNVYGEPTNPVLLLTSHEMTMNHYISSTWKVLGGRHEKFADYKHSRTLLNLADATQQIYLGMPPFHETREEYWKKRHARRKAATQKPVINLAGLAK
jgi:hypothetical protein